MGSQLGLLSLPSLHVIAWIIGVGTDWGCIWLHGRRVHSWCVWAWAVAYAERRLLSVTLIATSSLTCVTSHYITI